MGAETRLTSEYSADAASDRNRTSSTSSRSTRRPGSAGGSAGAVACSGRLDKSDVVTVSEYFGLGRRGRPRARRSEPGAGGPARPGARGIGARAGGGRSPGGTRLRAGEADAQGGRLEDADPLGLALGVEQDPAGAG